MSLRSEQQRFRRARHVLILVVPASAPLGMCKEADVPLSEHEQRLLEQMERALYAEDPKFVSTLRGASLRVRYRRRALLSAVGFVLGVVGLMTGLVTKLIAVSVFGFVLMLVSTIVAISAWRRLSSKSADLTSVTETGPGVRVMRRGGGRGPRTSLMQRLEQRWDRRRDERGSGF